MQGSGPSQGLRLAEAAVVTVSEVSAAVTSTVDTARNFDCRIQNTVAVSGRVRGRVSGRVRGRGHLDTFLLSTSRL